ncbi:uncharacterized protein [Temnothorax longispinosus]|uniref:uncharacterized protein isoform X2 n=1 Tax=Temnothorax longispinosus TaxID=300112 RepID=UPI003A990D9F
MKKCCANILFTGSIKHQLNFPRRCIDRLLNHPFFFRAKTSNCECSNFTKKNIIFSIFERVEYATFLRRFRGQTRTVSRRVMISIKTQHFRFNRILLLLIGLWPYERTRLVQFQITLFFGVVISSVIYQFAPLVFIKCTPDLVIDVLSIALFSGTFAISYQVFWIKVHAMKSLMDELQHICNDLKDKNEIAIITKYGNIAKRLTAIITLFHVGNISTISLLTVSLYLLDAVLLVEKSELRRIFQRAIPKFFIGREKYTYSVFLYYLGAACIGGTVLLGTGMMIVTYCKHACGIFRIARNDPVAGYRIEKAMMVNMENISLENEIIIRKEIILAVDIHRKAVQFSTLLFSTFNGLIFFLIIINVICLSFNLYRVSETMSREGDIGQCCIHFIITVAIFVYLFLANYVGQEITDYNNHVFFTAYNVRWYVTPLHVQRLILFLLQNGSKTFRMSLGGVLSLSIELFATLTKTSLSYFTVVYSMQQ